MFRRVIASHFYALSSSITSQLLVVTVRCLAPLTVKVLKLAPGSGVNPESDPFTND